MRRTLVRELGQCTSAKWITLLGYLALASATKLNLNAFRIQDPSASIFSNNPSQSTNLNITIGIGQTGQRLRFTLEENFDLSPWHTSIRYLDSNGVSHEANQSPSLYPLIARGSVLVQTSTDGTWSDVGWARIAVIEQKESPLFDGIFTIESITYEIHLETSDEEPTGMVAHRIEQANSLDDQPSLYSTCASPSNNLMNGKRQEWNAWGDDVTETIGSTNGCPSTRQIAYIGVATDCAYTASFNSTDDAHRHILNVINTASVVLENSFNVSIGIQNLTISDAECPNSVSDTTAWNAACSEGDLNLRLQRFSSWRSSINDNNAY
ncbi:uncharacterized protein N7443_000282 [Penicillium atrosanguineum]|uniref:uncharacterized protein n=1 Tax=Penicillium atrosanguineum TaxID=1132637 RepID=UPI0023A4A404|nr:uncharacterized protein N7443_000282 [Penicillium atrosanguineum]KAJ5313398.1 hypothetical protein N7443_000282 [Penicillium atrosanguineum]